MSEMRRVSIGREGRHQVIRIPPDFELEGITAVIRKEGDRLIIEPISPGNDLVALLETLEPLDDAFPEIDDVPATVRTPSTKLVHHPVESSKRTGSPFMMEMRAIAESSDLRIACPYLSLPVLRPILACSRSWRLLTDAEELLRSHGVAEREEWIEFFAMHQQRIRHWPGLHAKVVAGDESALVGSANLTIAGVAERQEMGVVLCDSRHVDGLRAWFDGLWNQCAIVERIDLENFARSLPPPPDSDGMLRLSSPVVRSSMRGIDDAKSSGAVDGEARLLSRLAIGRSRHWVEAYLEMCRDLLVSLDIGPDDPRLSMSAPEGALALTINQRYALCAFHRGVNVIGLILPHDFEVPAELVPDMNSVRDHLGSFKAWPDEPPENVPQFGFFDVKDPQVLLPMRDAWLDAVRRELRRPWKRSSFRRYHVPAFYCAAMDAEYRARVLDTAYSADHSAQ